MPQKSVQAVDADMRPQSREPRYACTAAASRDRRQPAHGARQFRAKHARTQCEV